MKVLNLVTTSRPFFEGQIQSIESKGIKTENISVPGTAGRRARSDYIKLYLKQWRKNPIKYDLVHANYGLTGPFALAQPTRPVVMTLWGSDLMGNYSSLSKRCAKFCDEVIVRSEEMAEELESNAHVIPAGVDLELFKPMEQRKALSKVGWTANREHILFPYNPERSVKNYPLAESVVKKANEQLQREVELQVVTDVSHDQIPLYLNAADSLLLTSKREGSPNTIKEAMACNTPVVSTDVGDVRDRLNGVEQSTVCETESELVDALVSILQSEKSSNGREHVKDISLERMGEQIIEVYEQALR